LAVDSRTKLASCSEKKKQIVEVCRSVQRGRSTSKKSGDTENGKDREEKRERESDRTE
jgi:hypothetical protein